LDQVLVTRLTCKVCGYVRRQYPVGVESGRLSLAMIHVCRLLRAFGLSYASLRAVLSGLGCPVSVGSLHRAANGQVEPPSGRLRLVPRPDNPTRLVGPDGRMRLRWSGRPDRLHGLNLVIEIAAGPEAAALRWRLERAIQVCWVHTKT
jgi:hypothetical protein